MKYFSLFFFIALLGYGCSGPSASNPASNPSSKKFSVAGKSALVYTTADSTALRLSLTDTLLFSGGGTVGEFETHLFIEPSKSFQLFTGIGGALTDAAAEVFSKLPSAKQQELMEAYFDADKGIGYTLARTNIHSCDFSSDMYTYADSGDIALKSFSVKHDEPFRIPFIKRAMETSKGKLVLFASPWSPPSWMKDNHDMLHGGKLKQEFYQVWANYYVKFIRAYEKAGIPIWGISIQNEPMAVQRWESCIYTAEEERDFLKNFLGPTLKKEGLEKIKVIIWDHNRNLLYQRASVLLNDPEAAKYAWAVGFHWYEDWMNSDQLHDNVRKVKESYPDKNVLLTEACNAPFDSKKINDWIWGERYGKAMIGDFNAGATGWTDWNILLDEKGGPNHVNNFCYAPVHADTRTGALIYTNAYYYIGHLSKFIRPGASRIESSASTSRLLNTAFMNDDGKIVVVTMNQTNVPIQYSLWIEGKSAKLTILPHAIQTIVL